VVCGALCSSRPRRLFGLKNNLSTLVRCPQNPQRQRGAATCPVIIDEIDIFARNPLCLMEYTRVKHEKFI